MKIQLVDRQAAGQQLCIVAGDAILIEHGLRILRIRADRQREGRYEESSH
jgi:hypothetical protein